MRTWTVGQAARTWAGLLAAATAMLGAPRAEAYTTRVHIVIANRMREALIANGGDQIPLRMGDRAVTLSREDADAIRNQPLAFRAGAIGPDNTVFPGLTDGTHGVEQDPFGQCELLYREAFTETERAYALGCFVHGSSDAIAHHLVNYFTGETFTLAPITVARLSSYTNAIRHISFESMVQDGAYRADAAVFNAGSMQHTIPQAFVLRTYFDERSPVWQRMSVDARARFDAARRALPDASLTATIEAAGLAPAEQLIMAPVYLREIDARRAALRAWVESEIRDLQSPTSTRGSELRVRPGPDGALGTRDDTTACSASCPTLFARYHAFVRILLPRRDAGGRELPSAFDQLSDRLGNELGRFLPSLVQTMQNLSTEFNRPLTAADSSFGVDRARLPVLMAPMRDWARGVTAIDFETIGRSVAPDWYNDLSDYFARFGVSVSIPDIIRAVFDPIITQVRSAIENYVTTRAETFLRELLTEYTAQLPGIRDEFNRRLTASTPPGVTGHALDNFFDAGFYAHAFNLSSASLARHELVLATGNPIETGPTSFDASYTPEWTQAGLCDYLGEHIFPLGTGVRALLSVRLNRTALAVMPDNAPVECHDGSLSSFGAPSAETCGHVRFSGLITMSNPRGSLSRAFPPDFAAARPACARLVVPGLPDPPPVPEPDAGVEGDAGEAPDAASESDAGTVSRDSGPARDAGGGTGSTGCGCRVPAQRTRSAPGVLTVLAALALVVARRGHKRAALRGRARIAALVVPALLAACSAPTDEDASADGATPTDAQPDAMDAPIATDAMDSRPTADVRVDAPVEAARDVPEDVPPDAPPDMRGVLAAALGDSVWQGTQSRLEGARTVERGYELHFRASSLQWAEIRNPYGPGRFRTLRAFNIQRDGRGVESIIMNPPEWERHPDAGVRETWQFEVLPGARRRLRITNAAGATETFTEGAFARPTTGLTAEVRVFATGGTVDGAFCGNGRFSGPDRPVLWDFARGRGAEVPLAQDVVAGARLITWRDTSGMNNFGVTDVDGFLSSGGTALSDQFNFIVRYTGTVRHTGGLFAMREADDDVLDAVWSFVNTGVGSLDPANAFLEVHGHAPADLTTDEPSAPIAAGDVPIEVMVLRCRADIGGQDVDVQVRMGATSAPWRLVGSVPSTPSFDMRLFPPAL